MYIVEGNIGVGKSVFLNLMHKLYPEIETVPEPLESWCNKDYGQSLLAEFYKDPSRWAYTLETLAMISRVRNHVEESNSSSLTRLMERSVYSGHYCFARNGYANKYLTEAEWRVYSDWVNFMVKGQCSPPLGFVYLRAEPKVCYERMLKRSRDSEKELKLEYIEQIHAWHEKFLIEKDGVFENIKNVPVLVLDCNKDFLYNEDQMGIHGNKLKSFISETSKNVQNNGINVLTY